jgi:hypothetical protein
MPKTFNLFSSRSHEITPQPIELFDKIASNPDEHSTGPQGPSEFAKQGDPYDPFEIAEQGPQITEADVVLGAVQNRGNWEAYAQRPLIREDPPRR